MILDGNKPQKLLNMQNSTVAKQVINPQLHQAASKENTKKFRRLLSLQSHLWIACLLGIGLMTTSCGSSKDVADAQSQSPNQQRGGATAVDVAIAKTGLIEKPKEYTGTSTPFRTVSVRSQIEARLLSLNLDVGDKVSQGQSVGLLDEALLLTALQEAQAELAALQSEVARAKTQVSNARAEVERLRLQLIQAQADSERQQKLFRQGAIAEQTAQQARTEAQTAQQALKAAQEQVGTQQEAVAAAQRRVDAQAAVVAQAKERRSYARLISPITGVVTEKVTEPGNLLQVGNEVLKIGDFNRVKVVVQVSELEQAQIQVGQSVQVRLDALPNQVLIGRVTRISPAADATARLIPIEVVIPNSQGRIGSGLLARVTFATQTPQRVIVSQSAIGQQAGEKQNNKPGESQDQTGTIFVVQNIEGKTKVSARAVTLGKKANGEVEILSGLQPGERYVYRSGKPLKNGDAVRLSILSEKAGSAPTGN